MLTLKYTTNYTLQSLVLLWKEQLAS